MAVAVRSAGGNPASQPKRKGGPCQSVPSRQQVPIAKGPMLAPPPGIPMPAAAPAAAAPQPGGTGNRRMPGNFMPRRLCTHWLQRGLCKRADECNFAHGFHELHPDSRAEGARQLGMNPAQAMQGAQAAGGMPGAVPVAPIARMQQHVSAQQLSAKAQGIGPPAFSMFTSVSVAGCEGALLPSPYGDCAAADPFKFNAGAAAFEPGPSVAGGVHDPFRFSVSATAFMPPPIGSVDDGGGPLEEHEIAPQKIELSSLTTATVPAVIPGLARRAPPSPAAALTDCTPKAGERRVSLVSSLKSPTAAQSPTARKASFGLMSPKVVSIAAPAVQNSSVMISAPALTLGSPTSARSPRVAGASVSFGGVSPLSIAPAPVTPKASPQSPTPLSRSVLLQARSFATRIDQGPPGLDMCAPTPTSKARNLGFRLPQPGLLTSAKISQSTPMMGRFG